MMRTLLIVGFLAIGFTSSAQYQDTVWTIKGPKALGDGFKKWRPMFALDARSSSINGQPVRIGGLRVGAELRRVHRFGIGFYGAQTKVHAQGAGEVTAGSDSARLNLNYATLFYDRVFLLHPKWELSAAVHLGTGQVWVETGPFDGSPIPPGNRVNVRLTEFSVSGYYHINWWLSAGGGAGYRQFLSAPESIAQAYDGGIYLIKVRLRLSRLVRRMWDESVRDEY